MKQFLSENKEQISTGIFLVLGCFCCALCYNLFLLPNNIVVSGVTGLSIPLQHIFKIDAQIFVYLGHIVLLVLCYLMLSKEETKNTIVGSLLYPVMITITKPIAAFLLPYCTFQEFIITAVVAGLLMGLGSGLIYRMGYNSGGADIIVRIMSEYLHIPEGKSTLISCMIVILFGVSVFGFGNLVYSIIIIVLNAYMVDKVLFGISDSKVFYVFTRKQTEIKRILLEDFHTGFTILPTKGGYSHKVGTIIMCVLPNSSYYRFKNVIMQIDPNAFYIINDCYESKGGFKQKNLPFL